MNVSDLIAAIERQTAVLEEIRDSLSTVNSSLGSLETVVFEIKIDVNAIDSQVTQATIALSDTISDLAAIRSDVSDIQFKISMMD